MLKLTTDNRFSFYHPSKHPTICCYELMPGDKIWGVSKEQCIELEQQLQQAGYKTKMAQNELGQWTIAILEGKND